MPFINKLKESDEPYSLIETAMFALLCHGHMSYKLLFFMGSRHLALLCPCTCLTFFPALLLNLRLDIQETRTGGRVVSTSAMNQMPVL